MPETSSTIPYLDDILHQPEALRDTLAGLAGTDFGPLSLLAQEVHSGRLRRIVLTGMGSSYHVFHPLQLSLIRHGIQSQMIETSELIHHAPGLMAPDTLIIAVSQSGASAELLQLIKQMPSQAPLIGITNTPSSPLCGRANALLSTQAGIEDAVSCKTYVTSLAALVVLEQILTAQNPILAIAEMQKIPDAVAAYLLHFEEYAAELEKRLKDANYLILAGRGVSLAAVGTGALINKEAAHFPTEGMSSAAFRHGPLEMAATKAFVLVYEGLDPTRNLNQNLVADINKFGGKAALVKTTSVPGVFSLPPVPASGLPILEILPAQLLSVTLARMQGHIPGRFSLGSKVTSSE